MKKVALLWESQSLGLYSNAPFDRLYRGVGHNNGNMAFVYAIANHIDAEVVFFPWHVRPELLADIDAIVIPCANQLGKHTDLGKLSVILDKADKPIIAIGLGAQANDMETDVEVTPGTLEWVRVIDSKRYGSAPNIYTRGPYTTRQLARLGIPDSVIGGCPSHFINQSDDLGHRIHRHWSSLEYPRAISVAGGHQAWNKCRLVEQQLVAMMMDPFCPGQYVVQSMSDMIKISRDEFDTIEPAVLDQINQHIIPHYNLVEFKAWCRTYARSFYDVPSWMDSLRRHDLTVGPRYHGAALTMQAERMALSVTIDSRTEEMCVQTGIPFVRVEDLNDVPLTRASLKSAVKFDPIAYDALRSERARNYVAFLESNGVKPVDYLKKIADKA